MAELLERFRALKSGLRGPLEQDSGEHQEAELEDIWEYDPDQGQEAAAAPAPLSLDERLAAAFREIVAEPYGIAEAWEEEAEPNAEFEVATEGDPSEEAIGWAAAPPNATTQPAAAASAAGFWRPAAPSAPAQPSAAARPPASAPASGSAVWQPAAQQCNPAFRPAPKVGFGPTPGHHAAATNAFGPKPRLGKPLRPAPVTSESDAPEPVGEDVPGTTPEARPRPLAELLHHKPKEPAMVPPKAKLGGPPAAAAVLASCLARVSNFSPTDVHAPKASYSHGGDLQEPVLKAPLASHKQGLLGGHPGVAPVPKERHVTPKATLGTAAPLAPVAKTSAMHARATAEAQAAIKALTAKPATTTTTTTAPAHAAAEQAEVAGPGDAADAEDPEVEAEMRLHRNKVTAQGWELIRILKEEFKLSPQVELGLKLLEPLKLWQILGKNGQSLRLRLKVATDKDTIARAIVAASDPSADKLVKRLMKKEEEQKARGQESKVTVEGSVAGDQAAQSDDVAAQEAAFPQLQTKVLPRITWGQRPAPRTHPPVQSQSLQGAVQPPPLEEPHPSDHGGSHSNERDRRLRGRNRSRSRSHGAHRHEEPQRSARERASQQLPSDSRKPRGSAGRGTSGGGEKANDLTDELGQWLTSIDNNGALQRYNEALHREFSNLEQLTAAFIPSPPGVNKGPLAMIEPSVFQALGVQLLGHKLLFAKGIIALCSPKP